MIKTLYTPFRRWTEKGTLWVYSDPHFSDPDMVELRKNYIGDEEQVARINSKVGKNDTIIFLGDIGNEEMIRKIRGYKVLIMGNHDKGASKYTDIFDEVYEGPLFIAEKLILSHEPVDLPFAFNIHGHEHRYIHRDNDLNVCAEHIDYHPVNLNSLIKKGLLSGVESIHRMTIDRATVRKKNIVEKGVDCGFVNICADYPEECQKCKELQLHGIDELIAKIRAEYGTKESNNETK